MTKYSGCRPCQVPWISRLNILHSRLAGQLLLVWGNQVGRVPESASVAMLVPLLALSCILTWSTLSLEAFSCKLNPCWHATCIEDIEGFPVIWKRGDLIDMTISTRVTRRAKDKATRRILWTSTKVNQSWRGQIGGTYPTVWNYFHSCGLSHQSRSPLILVFAITEYIWTHMC